MAAPWCIWGAVCRFLLFVESIFGVAASIAGVSVETIGRVIRSPATVGGAQTALLLLIRQWGGIPEADDLVEQLITRAAGILLRRPVFAIKGAGTAMAAVVTSISYGCSLVFLLLGNG